jgi:hypothetical protein
MVGAVLLDSQVHIPAANATVVAATVGCHEIGRRSVCGVLRDAEAMRLRGPAYPPPFRPRSRNVAVASLLGGLSILASSAALCDPVTTQLAALNAVCRSAIDSRDFDNALRLCKRVSFDAS